MNNRCRGHGGDVSRHDKHRNKGMETNGGVRRRAEGDTNRVYLRKLRGVGRMDTGGLEGHDRHRWARQRHGEAHRDT